MESQKNTKFDRTTQIAECISSAGVMCKHCDPKSIYWNKATCYSSFALAESCIKKIYRGKKDS
ncbi:hypothetical protein [Cedratvirus kamchatka]|uniref:Uncharacterized protein n=1 Tax=Cedratvirus kamchatka TaxID=2716914 RepID=A0A6G8MY16_9VIRU|nr:hypothetical protein [Cedratvirus kamchatka]WIL04299.1 hypothetical protein Clen_369 [Cedratvirus lena]WIL04921.1 hypothetical protein Cduv_441 [Cedratvirus duvanny]